MMQRNNRRLKWDHNNFSRLFLSISVCVYLPWWTRCQRSGLWSATSRTKPEPAPVSAGSSPKRSAHQVRLICMFPVMMWWWIKSLCVSSVIIIALQRVGRVFSIYLFILFPTQARGCRLVTTAARVDSDSDSKSRFNRIIFSIVNWIQKLIYTHQLKRGTKPYLPLLLGWFSFIPLVPLYL